MFRRIDLTAYSAGEPLLFMDTEPHAFAAAVDWQQPVRFVDALQASGTPLAGLVVPLEMKAPGWRRQDLFGLELLSYLRWSASAEIRGIPVLALAWQPLNNILCRRFEPLLIQPAIEFCRLPEGIERIASFCLEISTGKISPAAIREIETVANRTTGLPSKVSYHNLANDYYAAHRLWKGYQSLVSQAANEKNKFARTELARTKAVHFEWEAVLEQKLRSPLVRQFQAQRAEAQVPRYPTVDNALRIIEHHVEHGVPKNLRILLVDDEFDKGAADVLLQILFQNGQFTRCLADEWVYSEGPAKPTEPRWARLVCVRSAWLARNWLAHWGELQDDSLCSRKEWEDWLDRWRTALALGGDTSRSLGPDSDEVLGENRNFIVDSKRSIPHGCTTMLLLDLRLTPVTDRLYSIKQFPSIMLRHAIKTQKPQLPILMFTASRQMLNFIELADSMSEVDGWLVKEGPDIPVDEANNNSANAAAYLLERTNLFSNIAAWYRESCGWTTERKLSYAQLYQSPLASKVFKKIADLSSEIFDQIRNTARSESGQTFWAFIQSRVHGEPFPIVQTLVARRVALGTLLLTATQQSDNLEWNADEFNKLLPGRPVKKLVKAIYDKINFNQVLWMRTSSLLSQLLQEELEWLENQEWPIGRRNAVLKLLEREHYLNTP